MTLVLESNAFYAGGRLPAKFTCDGENASPPLLWSKPPEGTRSLALVCSDPDAPSGTFYHWAIYNMSPDTGKLPEHYPAAGLGKGPLQATNDFGRTGYSGPCPPKGHGVHRYFFRLYALDVERLPIAHPAHARDVESAAEEHAIARAELMAMYER